MKTGTNRMPAAGISRKRSTVNMNHWNKPKPPIRKYAVIGKVKLRISKVK